MPNEGTWPPGHNSFSQGLGGDAIGRKLWPHHLWIVHPVSLFGIAAPFAAFVAGQLKQRDKMGQECLDSCGCHCSHQFLVCLRLFEHLETVTASVPVLALLAQSLNTGSLA